MFLGHKNNPSNQLMKRILLNIGSGISSFCFLTHNAKFSSFFVVVEFGCRCAARLSWNSSDQSNM